MIADGRVINMEKEYFCFNDNFRVIVKKGSFKGASLYWKDGTTYHYRISIILDNNQELECGYESSTDRATDYARFIEWLNSN